MDVSKQSLALILGAVVPLFLVWAALHDISRGDSDLFEYAGLAIGVAVLAVIHRKASRILARREKLVWLAFSTAVLLLFDLSALSARVNPKYVNDVAAGSAFLFVSLPLLGYFGYHLVRTSFFR